MAADSREKILRRIREALAVEAPARHLHGTAGLEGHPPQDWLPPVPDSPAELLGLFEKNSGDLKTVVHRCSGTAEAALRLKEIAAAEKWTRVATHDFELGNAAVEGLGLPVLKTDEPYEALDLEGCDAGISGCDCLIAQTGGILVTAASAGGRALSVLPPHHIVIARGNQLVADLADAFAHVRKLHGGIPAFLSFITGPSRTGDIERILVLGAHGPKRLTVLLIEE